MLDLFGFFFGKIGRTGLFCHPRLVFVLIIVGSLERFDLDQRQRFAVDQTAGKLTTFDELFDHHFIIISFRFFESILQLCVIIYKVNTNR